MRNHRRFLSLALASSMILSQFAMTTYATEEYTEEDSSTYSDTSSSSKEEESVSMTPLDPELLIVNNPESTESEPSKISDEENEISIYEKDVNWIKSVEKNDDGVPYDFDAKITFNIATGAITDATSNISSVDIPSTINVDGKDYDVKIIYSRAFYKHPELTSIVIPEGVTTLGFVSFTECPKLSKVVFPTTLTSVENGTSGVFMNCPLLMTAGPADDGNDYNYVLPNPKTTNLPGATELASSLFGRNQYLESVVIPEGVVTMGSSILDYSTGLTSISLPDSLRTIGINAFYNCSALKELHIPEGVTELGQGIFYGCNALENLYLPSTLGATTEKPFERLKLTSMGPIDSNADTIYNMPDTIPSRLFVYFSTLKDVIIPTNVTTIEERAFFGCSGITDVYYMGSKSEWDDISIETYNTALTEARIHYNYQLVEGESTITLDPNGGGFLISPSEEGGTVQYIQTPVEMETNKHGYFDEFPVPVQGGYEFLYWKNASGEQFTEDSQFASDQTMTAVWKECEHFVVTFDYEQDGKTEKMKTNKENTLYLLAEDAEKIGHQFEYWQTEVNGQWVRVTTAHEFSDDTIVYPKWKTNADGIPTFTAEENYVAVLVVDKFNQPVADVPFVWSGVSYSTDKNGIVYCSDVETERVTFSFPGYSDRTVELDGTLGKFNTVVLYDESEIYMETFEVYSVDSYSEGSYIDLLTAPFYRTLTQGIENRVSFKYTIANKPADITSAAIVNSKGDIVGTSTGLVITSNTTGERQESFMMANEDDIIADLIQDEYYLMVAFEDGTAFRCDVPMKFDQFIFEFPHFSYPLNLGNEFSFFWYDWVPIVGGTRFVHEFDAFFPFTVEIDPYWGYIEYSINATDLLDDKDKTNFEKLFSATDGMDNENVAALKSAYNDYDKMFSNLFDKRVALQYWEHAINFDVIGYANQNYNFITGDWDTFQLKGLAGLSFSGKSTKFAPLFSGITLSGTLGFDLGMQLGFISQINTNQEYVVSGMMVPSMGCSASATLALLHKELLSGSLTGTLGGTYYFYGDEHTNTEDSQGDDEEKLVDTFNFDTSVFLSATVLGVDLGDLLRSLNIIDDPILLRKLEIAQGYSKANGLSIRYTNPTYIQEMIESTTAYIKDLFSTRQMSPSMVHYSYPEFSSFSRTASKFVTDENTFNADVGTALDSDPKILSIDGTSYMFWVGDPGNQRADVNRMALFYAIFDESSQSWGSKKQIFVEDENSTSDVLFDVAADENGRIHLLVAKNATVHESTADFTTVADDVQIVYTSIDTKGNHVVSEATVVGASDYVTSSPTLSENGSHFAWVEYGESLTMTNLFGEGTQKITLHYGSVTDGANHNTLELDHGIHSLAVGELGDDTYWAYILSSESNGGVYVCDMDSSTPVRIAEVSNGSDVKFSGGVLYWFEEGNIKSYDGGEIKTLFSDEETFDLNGTFQVIHDGDGTEKIIWSTAEYVSSTEYKVLVKGANLTDGVASTSYKVSETGSAAISQLSGFIDEDGKTVVSYQNTVEDGDDVFIGVQSTVQEDRVDPEIEYIAGEDEFILSQTEITLTATIVNHGAKTLDNFSIKDGNGNIIATFTDVNLALGETKDFEFTYTTPNIILKQTETFVIVAEGDQNSENNTCDFQLGELDLALTASRELLNGRYVTNVIISNESYIPASGTLRIRNYDESGDIFYEEKIGKMEYKDVNSVFIDLSSLEEEFGRVDFFYVEIVADAEESVTINNSVSIFVGLGREPAKETYTITYNANGGTVSQSSGTTDSTTGKLTSLPTPTRTGYTFDGWYTASTGGTKVSTSTIFDDDTIIYAQWTKNSTDSGTPDSDSDTPDSSTPDSDSDTPDSDSNNDNSNNSGSSNNSSSNSSTSTSTTTYTNSLPTSDYGTVNMTPKNPKSGDTVSLEISPNDGYEVDEVIVTRTSTGAEIEVTLNEDGTYSFTQPSGTVAIEVVYKEKEEKSTIIDLPIVNNMNTSTFNDMTDPTQWYYDSVKFVYDRGLMSGTGNDEFSPEMTTSRGMIVQILYRLAGSPSTTGANFSDVSSTDYYSQAVAWASSIGVATGTGDGQFSPNKDMSREELVVMLYAYEKIYGNNEETDDLYLAFSDNDSISTWAEEAVAWAVEKGIVFGRDDNNFDPQGSAKRCEVAQILKNFIELYA